MVKNYPDIDKLELDGGLLCLNFINTTSCRKEGATFVDHVDSFDKLLYWATQKVTAVTTKTGKALDQRAGKEAEKSQAFFKEAMELRELLFRIFKAVSEEGTISKDDLKAFNMSLSEYFSILEIKVEDGQYKEGWGYKPDNFCNITAPILKSAHELLLSGKLNRVKQCPSCGWLFYDTTKNGKRRWCSMEACGCNVKSLEYYYRKKAGND